MSDPPTASPPWRSLSVEQVTANFDEVLAAVEREGAAVRLTREEIPVAVLLPWAQYRATLEMLARLELAYWSAWSDDGAFDNEHLRQAVAALVEDRPPGTR